MEIDIKIIEVILMFGMKKPEGAAPNYNGLGTTPEGGDAGWDDMGPDFYDKTAGNALTPWGELRADMDRVPETPAGGEALSSPEAALEQLGTAMGKIAEGAQEAQAALKVIRLPRVTEEAGRANMALQEDVPPAETDFRVDAIPDDRQAPQDITNPDAGFDNPAGTRSVDPDIAGHVAGQMSDDKDA